MPNWADAASVPMPGASHQAGATATSPIDTGPLFVDLRRCLGMSLPDIARRLETRVEVLMALESGDVSRLPSWPETVRVVSAYTMLARIDPRPVLGVLAERISVDRTLAAATGRKTATGVPRRRSKSGQNAIVGAVAAAGGVLRLILPGAKRGAAILSSAAVVGVLAVILLLSVVPSKLQQASATGGSGLLGGLHNYVVGQFVTVRDGFRWIEVDDPRSRKSDKLRSDKR